MAAGDRSFLEAVVADEVAAIGEQYRQQVTQLESALKAVEAKSEMWMSVLDVDSKDGIDPVAHSVLAKLDRIVDASGASRQDTESGVAVLEAQVAELARRVEEALASKSKVQTRENHQDPATNYPGNCLDQTTAQELVETMLEKFSADVIGKSDYALAAVGGSIERRKGLTSPDYMPSSFHPFQWFFSVSRSPEAAIQSDMTVGNCWACSLEVGCNITIKLAQPTDVQAISIDHISSKIAHDFRSAPKSVRVFGLTDLPAEANDESSHRFLGQVEYDVLQDRQVQTFPLENTANAGTKYSWVKFQVVENHGHPDYVCIYRVRVHL